VPRSARRRGVLVGAARVGEALPVEPRSDQALVEALGLGEGGALTELYARHGAVVYRMALRAAGNAEDAADVTQEAFLHVLQRAGELHLTGRATSYLYPVVTRLARRARERAGRHVDDGEAFLAAALALVDPGASDGRAEADRAELARALAFLPATQREALLLRYADGLSVEEAAAALGCPEGTVRSRVHHALHALRSAPGLGERLER
jgi:RNA polymerase sigma-70 factor (ECF subfamily)